ncbi:MAG: DegV family protein [Anaerolineae bacterium]|nr:DegV family protein [Anaerolineae bacterium]
MPTLQSVRVVTDSTACVPQAWCQEGNISVVPLLVAFGEEVFRDGVDLTPEEFYRRLTEGDVLPVTSQPPVGAFQDVYGQLVDEGHAVVSIHLSSGLSGTVASAQAAANEFPGADIRVIDSRTVSMAFGWAVVAAARAAAAGLDADTVEKVAQDVLARSRFLCMLDTLEYLYKGGRIGKASSLLGALLAIKPVVSVDGVVVPVEKPRTRRAALQRIAQMVRQDAPLDHLCLAYTRDEDNARALGALLEDVVDPREVLYVEGGPVLGTYGGPGAVAACYVVRKRSQ